MATFWLEGVLFALWRPLFMLNNREKHHIMHTMMILGVIMKCNTAKLFLQMSASWCPETFPEQWVYFFMKLFKVANNPTNCWNSIHGYNLARKSNALQWLATFLLNHRERHQNIRAMMVLLERESKKSNTLFYSRGWVLLRVWKLSLEVFQFKEGGRHQATSFALKMVCLFSRTYLFKNNMSIFQLKTLWWQTIIDNSICSIC